MRQDCGAFSLLFRAFRAMREMSTHIVTPMPSVEYYRGYDPTDREQVLLVHHVRALGQSTMNVYFSHYLEGNEEERSKSTEKQQLADMMADFHDRTAPLRAAFRRGALTTAALQERLEEVAATLKDDVLRIWGEPIGRMLFYDLLAPKDQEQPWSIFLVKHVATYHHPLSLIDRMVPTRDAGHER